MWTLQLKSLFLQQTQFVTNFSEIKQIKSTNHNDQNSHLSIIDNYRRNLRNKITRQQITYKVCKRKIVGNTMITILETINGDKDPISVLFIYFIIINWMLKKVVSNLFGM